MRLVRPRAITLRGRVDVVFGLMPIVVLLVGWEVIGDPGSPFYPSPSSWWPALFVRGQGSDIIPAVLDTFQTFGLGLAVATVIGTAAGIAVGGSATADRALHPTFEFLRAIPPAALVPVATLLLGFDEEMKVVVVVVAAVWPVLLNTRTGVHEIDPTLLDAARSMRLSTATTLRSLVLPSVSGHVLLGVRVATPIALVITLLVEYLTAVNGLGALIGDAQRTFQPARVYALIVIASLLSLVVNAIVRSAEARSIRRRTGSATLHAPSSFSSQSSRRVTRE